MRTAIDKFRQDWSRDGSILTGPLCVKNKLTCKEVTGLTGYPKTLETLLEVEHALMKAAPDVPSLPAMPSLPPERPRVGGPVGPTRKMLAHAATEAMETGDELAAMFDGDREVTEGALYEGSLPLVCGGPSRIVRDNLDRFAKDFVGAFAWHR